MRFQTVNNFSTTLSASLSSGATSMQVTDASQVPSSVSDDQPLAVTLEPAGASNPSISDLEIVHVTGKSGTDLTIVRGQQGTTAKGWSSGDTAEGRLPAAVIDQFLQVNRAEQLTEQPGMPFDSWWLTHSPSSGKGPTGSESVAIGSEASVPGDNSLAMNNATVSGDLSFGAGFNMEVLGEGSFGFARESIIAAGQYDSAIIGGRQQTIDAPGTSRRNLILGGEQNTIDGGPNEYSVYGSAIIGSSYSSVGGGNNALVLGGYNNSVEGSNSIAAGNSCTATGGTTTSMGNACKSITYQAHAFGSYGYGFCAYSIAIGGGYRGPYAGFASAHQSLSIARGLASTDDSATTPAYQFGIAVGLNNACSMAVQGQMVAASESGDRAAWRFDGFIYSDGSVAQVESLNKTMIGYTGDGGSWDWTLVDTGNGDAHLEPEVTGSAALAVDWALSMQAAHIYVAN